MADNFTFLNASQLALTARSAENGGVHTPATVLADSGGVLIPDDDAAAAGPIFPAAGVYQATPTEVDDGDVGRVRMSARRVLRTGVDSVLIEAFNSGGSEGATDGDIRDTSTHDFDSSDLARKKNRTIAMINGLDQALTVRLYDTFTGLNLYNDTLSAGARLILTPNSPHSTGSTTSILSLSALSDMYLFACRLRISAAVAPASGTFRARVHYEE